MDIPPPPPPPPPCEPPPKHTHTHIHPLNPLPLHHTCTHTHTPSSSILSTWFTASLLHPCRDPQQTARAPSCGGWGRRLSYTLLPISTFVRATPSKGKTTNGDFSLCSKCMALRVIGDKTTPPAPSLPALLVKL
ncbi:hypothetical protein JOB18_030679 [Solea senegalensis]|uniref:Uncharacterized protein n=1 Tax=Solea senegalensis TaxID=28829 RepID=A0AAV6STZ6_SOLSE|nr:hypothetical protein JOB18_030679 [Solea senegalensis]